MSKKTESKPLSPQTGANKTGAKPAKPGELSESDLEQVAGGKHPAKVTVPDLKLGIS